MANSVIERFYGHWDWEFDSEEEAIECEEAGEVFFPDEIKGKGFQYFYYGEVEGHGIFAKYLIEITDDNFYFYNEGM